MVNAQKWKKWTIGEMISRTKTTIQTGPFGTVLSASEFVDYGIPIISVREIREGFIRITAETPCITDDTYSRLGKYALSEKDIVFARKGSVERSALIPIGLERYFLGSDGIRIRFDQNIVSPDLMLYLFQSPSTKQFLIQSSYGTTMAGLNEKILSALEFYLPETIDEQERIAKVLADIDHLLALTEKLITKKKAIKQGAMQELLTGKRRLPGFSGEWETKKLEDYCSLITKQTGFDYSAYIKPALITRKMPNTFPMIQTINFRGRKFTFETDYYIPKPVAIQFPNILLNKKCVLFSIVGASVGNVGLYPGSVTAFCGGAIGITRFRNEQDAEWVYNYMSSPDGQSQIQYVTKGGAQATVTIADIRNFKIPTPEKGERDAISGILENMDHEIEALEQKLAKYRQVKQGMMQQLLSGKIRLV